MKRLVEYIYENKINIDFYQKADDIMPSGLHISDNKDIDFILLIQPTKVLDRKKTLEYCDKNDCRLPTLEEWHAIYNNLGKINYMLRDIRVQELNNSLPIFYWIDKEPENDKFGYKYNLAQNKEIRDLVTTPGCTVFVK